MLVPSYMKELYLVYLLNMISPIKELNKEIKNFEKKPKSIIIFTKTCELCEQLTKMLNKIGFKSKHLHSVLKQKERLSNLDEFRNCMANILVCTNVASR
jgi:superfamily II DNA/RNA helicase